MSSKNTPIIVGIVVVIIVVVIAALLFLGGGKTTETPTTTGGATETTPTRISLTTAGGTPGGVGFAIMSAAMSTTTVYYPNISYTIVPGGWLGNIERVDKGELDLGHTTVVASTLAVKSIGPFEGKPKPENVRGVVCDQIEIFYFIVARADFPFDVIDDVGKNQFPLRVTNQPAGTFGGWLWEYILNQTGASPDNLAKWGGEYTRVTWGEAASLLADGHVDAILAVGGKKIGWLEQLTATKDVKYVGVSDQLADKIASALGLQKVVIPAGTFPKQDNDIVAFKDTGLIIANANVPEWVTYSIVKAIAEHPDLFKKQHAMLATFKPGKGMFECSPFPLHPGAEKAYQELGYKS